MARRPGSLLALSTSDIHRELRRRQRSLPMLMKRRAAAAAKLAAIDGQIDALSGTSGRGAAASSRSGRAKNSMTLVEALSKVLSGKQLTIAQAMDAVKAAGYKTDSKSFRISVNATLLKFKKKFKKVARGIYTAA